MNNAVYITEYSKKLVGLDNYTVEDENIKRSPYIFTSNGSIRPFSTRITPKLDCAINVGNSSPVYYVSPKIGLDITDNLELNIGNSVTNQKLDVDGIKNDIYSLALGNTNVEYFKNFEKGVRSLEKGYLDGKRGSYRSIGLPTGTLYGKNVIEYGVEKVVNTILGELQPQTKAKVVELLNKEKLTLDDLRSFLNSKEEFKGVISKLSKKENYEKYILEAMNEIGLHENEERSSYDILEYVPKSFKSEVSSIKTPSLALVGLPLLGIKKDILHLYPKEELKDIDKILGANKFLDAVYKIEPTLEKATPLMKCFDKFTADIAKIDADWTHANNQCKPSWWDFFGVSTAACKAKNGVFYGGKKTLIYSYRNTYTNWKSW